ncbi:MAG: hypothetical protein KGH75_12540 [Rhodospirillales bacterium]|nr:hypothetical protein [Rhodospirillales bacterium]
MIHYHGLPITPATVAARAVAAGHAFVSFAHPDQLTIALEVAQSFAIDNGAFSAWKSGRAVLDWRPYYLFVGDVARIPGFDFAVIPDVIDGDEVANDALVAEWPFRGRDIGHGAPVWHLHESLDRLERLVHEWPRVCLGSSGEFSSIGTLAWWSRMAEAMAVVCDRDGRPVTKLHGLRMLDPEIFGRFPFHSADSTNIGRNVGIDSAWRGTYTPPTKECRAQVMRERIESHNSAAWWEVTPIQQGLFA